MSCEVGEPYGQVTVSQPKLLLTDLIMFTSPNSLFCPPKVYLFPLVLLSIATLATLLSTSCVTTAFRAERLMRESSLNHKDHQRPNLLAYWSWNSSKLAFASGVVQYAFRTLKARLTRYSSVLRFLSIFESGRAGLYTSDLTEGSGPWKLSS